jgi:hypothetical protein
MSEETSLISVETGGAFNRGGRPKGSVNKATAEIKALAQEHSPEAIRKLVHLMRNGESEETQRAAANDILNRGHGKPTQMIAGNKDADPLQIEGTATMTDIAKLLLASIRDQAEDIEATEGLLFLHPPRPSFSPPLAVSALPRRHRSFVETCHAHFRETLSP